MVKRHAFMFVLITVAALGVTAGYTSDLEMAWLAAFLLVPAWGLVVGGVFGLGYKLLARVPWTAVGLVILFSIALHTGLMVEEAAVGVMRQGFNRYTEHLRRAEQARPMHEVLLGEGKILYFRDVSDESFQLNFEHARETTISRSDIVDLAGTWLANQGYPEAEVTVEVYPAVFRKGIFSLVDPATVAVQCELMQTIQRDDYAVRTLYLELLYDPACGLNFKEAGWASAIE